MSCTASRVLALALFALTWFGTLSYRPLMRADEGRYAEVAREMVASGHWITPHLNGFKYFEKPPLQYWVTASAFEVFGLHDWVSRLWPALTGFAGLAMVLWFGRRLRAPPAGRYAAAVLAGSPLYAFLGQFDTLDMGVSVFLAFAVLAFAFGQRDAARPSERRAWMLIFWASCALATLSKGLIGFVLPGIAIGLYVLLHRDWRLISRVSWGAGLTLFLTIAAPWFVVVSLRNPHFAHFFFIEQHFERYLTHFAHRYEPPWYFIPVLAVGMGPWLLPLGPAVWRGLRHSAGKRFRPQQLLALWAIVVFAFFSASDSKLASYILPIVPTLAVLVGDYLAAQQPRRLLAVQGALLASVGIALAALAPHVLRAQHGALAPLLPGYVPWLVAAGGCLALSGAAGSALAWRARIGPAVAVLALGSFGATLLGMLGHRALAPAYSTERIVARARPELDSRAPFYAVDYYNHTLPWYLRRTVTMVAYKGELAQEIGWDPAKFVPDLASFALAWRADTHAGAIFTTRDFFAFQRKYHLRMQVIARDDYFIIVRKP